MPTVLAVRVVALAAAAAAGSTPIAARADASLCLGKTPPAGCVTARGAAAPDPSAPNERIARVRAERLARERADGVLFAALGAVRLPDGGTVSHRLLTAASAALRIADLVRHASVAVVYHSDGGVVVREAILDRDLLAALSRSPSSAPTSAPVAAKEASR